MSGSGSSDQVAPGVPGGTDTWEGPHVTETIEPTTTPKKKKSGGLNTMLMADLKSMAGGLGIRGAGSNGAGARQAPPVGSSASTGL